ncbi:hypothetical protein LO772_27865 [Yinghuangia sp. ASG 101]|uniref:hypothetical protein n=1 Tax=Yinghuangia sp. ASG 101 TaxID=2896848 RepID=UPI001E3CA49F|nr:hypothetical protein [Yinghuangia sp. ASG 101]UGQ10623.1 hypothetical protein LO772_27865 [Yinghuangia sp. ASG 101]
MSVTSVLPRATRTLPLTIVLTAASAATLVTLPGNAAAAPGDNGDVRIHATSTAFDDPRDETKVCRFYLAASAFDQVQAVTWSIAPQPDRVGGAALDGALALTTGTGHTGPLSLPAGQYRLTWTFAGQTGAAKQKVFEVACPTDNAIAGTVQAPQDRDVFGNLVPAGGADLGSGSTAPSDDAPRTAAGIAIVAGALFFGLRLLRRSRR